MLYSIPYDTAGFGYVLLVFGFVAFLVFSIVVFILEAVVLWLLKWDAFGRSLWASFVMNLASNFGGLLAVAVFGGFSDLLGFIFALLLSILIEGEILVLMKWNATRENWRDVIIANLTSYGLLGVFLLFRSKF